MCEDELEEVEEKEMKKIFKNKKFIQLLTMAVILFLLLFCTGCGNKQHFDFDYTFDKAICNIGGEYKEFKLASWTDYEGEQLQLMDKEGNKYLVSSINCTLIKEK